ncbi:MAG: DNA (cytosine-5-)-methyltransferase [Deferribacteraceae bacterium]|jgi:DNA (cytosine-5)-methyltransferase 1|nr:DNA (cytosine-5-)-methyltransferase [Deferribacteraceae bacterium]
MKLTALNASELLGISADTIRRWDKKGLIKSTRNEQNYRFFDIEEIKRLQNKLHGTSLNNFKILKSSQRSQYNVIELFAGAGGTALGFENAGLTHALLNEFDKDCVETLKGNLKGVNLIAGDIRNIDFSDYKDKIDIVQAGFPCQAFSYAGKGLGFEEARGTLFFEFARCIKETNPKIAVGENVRGLLNHDNGKTLQTMVNIIQELGYKVKYKVLRSQYLDVPQKRERLIILAIRNNLDIPFVFPKEKDYTVSLREVLIDCPPSDGQKYPKKKYDILKLVPEGGYWRDLPINLQKEYMAGSFHLSGGKTGMARRLSWDEPSLTLTCAPAQKQTERCHPSETRPLNIREYARIQTFPDDWNFSGSLSSQYKQIGNAVPVNLAYHIGCCLIAMLDNKIDDDTMLVEN